MKDYIKKSSRNSVRFVGEYPISSWGLQMVVAKQITNSVDPNSVIKRLISKIPAEFARNVDAIYVGEFEHLKKNDFNASYSDGVIYVSHEQDSEDDMLDDIVHEIGHAVEEDMVYEIYGDKLIEREFLGKRQRLYSILESENYKPSQHQSAFMSIKYDEALDNYFYMEVGYPFLEVLSANLFLSPYSATSIREYFATGFEAIFFSDKGHQLKKISPVLYNRIKKIERILK